MTIRVNWCGRAATERYTPHLFKQLLEFVPEGSQAARAKLPSGNKLTRAGLITTVSADTEFSCLGTNGSLGLTHSMLRAYMYAVAPQERAG